MTRWPALACVFALSAASAVAAPRRLESTDYFRMRAVTSVQLSPDGARAAYTVQTNDGPGRPRTQLWVVALPDGTPTQVGGADARGSDPTWSPDGRWIAYAGTSGDKDAILVVAADGAGAPRVLAETSGTNSPLTFEGRAIAWSPDGKQIAFVSDRLTPYNPDLFVMNADGSRARRVNRPFAVSGPANPAWQPRAG
jgi:Tol biopolymer transport system component